jgi:hypothetical protein
MMLHLAPGWKKVIDQGRQQMKATPNAPAVTPSERPTAAKRPATAEPSTIASDNDTTATTEGGAMAAMNARSRPNGTTSAATARQPSGSSGDENGSSRLARHMRDITNGIPAKVTSA